MLAPIDRTFWLECALAGQPIHTRSGKPARLVRYEPGRAARCGCGADCTCHVVLVQVDGSCYWLTRGGRWNTTCDTWIDLCMSPLLRVGWINVYRRTGPEGDCLPCGRFYTTSFHATRESADAHASSDRVACLRSEWLEP